MSGISLFLLGTIAIANVGLVAFLINDANGKNRSPQLPKPDKEPEVAENSPVVEQPPKSAQSLIGKSKTRIEDFDERFDKIEQRFERLAQMMEKMETRVRFQDVEFANESDVPTKEEIAKDDEGMESSEDNNPTNDARMTPEQEAAAFQDVRIEDVDSDMVSAPSASGSTIEDIEEAVDAAINPNASAESKRRAGRVLKKFEGTNFFDTLISIDTTRKELMKCMTMGMKDSIADKDNDAKPQRKVPHQPKAKSIPPKKKGFHISENFDDFNPEDLIRK